MSKIFMLCAFAVVSSIVVGCTAETEAVPADESQGITADAITVVGAIECNPRTDRGCDRGDSCLGVNTGRETKYVCAANRCLEQDDCRAGYSCRVNHCIALEREEVRPDGRDVRDVDAARIRHELRDELARRRAAAAANDPREPGRDAERGR